MHYIIPLLHTENERTNIKIKWGEKIDQIKFTQTDTITYFYTFKGIKILLFKLEKQNSSTSKHRKHNLPSINASLNASRHRIFNYFEKTRDKQTAIHESLSPLPLMGNRLEMNGASRVNCREICVHREVARPYFMDLEQRDM